jgi:hypothetical protein
VVNRIEVLGRAALRRIVLETGPGQLAFIA